MAFNNRNNLSNESAPWGREVEQKVESNTYNLNQLRLLTENNNKATNGTLSALTRQQQTLADQQTQLQATQQTLAEQQTQLQVAQSELVALNATRVVASFVSASTTSTTTIQDLLVTIPFPEWATTAVATVTVRGSGNFSANPNVQVRAEVFGSDLSGAGTATLEQTARDYTYGYKESALPTGIFSASPALTTLITKTEALPAVSAKGVWNQSLTSPGITLRITLTVLFTSQ